MSVKPAQHDNNTEDRRLFEVPYFVNNAFVGRVDILKKMCTTIDENKSKGGSRPLVLRGLGGMGKTQLMLKYCYAHAEEYDYVFWLEVDGRAAVLDGFRNLAQTLGLNMDTERDGENIIVWVRRWFEQHKKWLLLLDNAEDMDDLFRCIPHRGGDIIMTTRNYISDEDAVVIPIHKMNVEDAMLLILGSDGVPSTDSTEWKNERKIVEELDCMPLALSLVRGYITRTQTSYGDY